MQHRCFLLLLATACARIPTIPPVANRYTDPTQREIATAQDERRPAALLPFLTNPIPAYRQAAASALASVQDKKTTSALLPLLRDRQPAVRRAAAYALGQAADSTAVDSLQMRVVLEREPLVRRYVQEALGRCVTRVTLPKLWQVPLQADTSRAVALAAGLERAAIRGLGTRESIRRTTDLLTDFPALPLAGRRAAAVALARAPRRLAADVAQLAGPVLLRLLADDADFAVRSAAATALGHAALAVPKAGTALLHAARYDADARVRVVAVRALPASAAQATSQVAVLAALSDPRPGVALTAAEWLLAHGNGAVGTDLAARAANLPGWRPRAVLLGAALRLADAASRPGLVRQVQVRYQTAPTPYEKGFLLLALGEAPETYDWLDGEIFAPDQNPVVAGYGLTALLAQRRRPDFPPDRQADFAALLRRALGTGDLNLVGLAAEALGDKELFFKAPPEALRALHTAQDRLTLPRDVEAWQGIQTALDRLEGRATPTAVPLGTAAQHPIDWALVQTIPQNARVRMQTTRGDIVLTLKTNEAPGAVGSFVALLRQGFYDGLAFHRVVPNFVAQGGDPRGDGSGSAPYTLRSEFADLQYATGSVGLASAGKDTESCQFFCTLAPTPHLDGRYPIFAQVVEGLDVLPKLEIGDRILKVQEVVAK